MASATREHLGGLWRELKIALTPVPKGKRWVFIVGCYNSGTTLLAEMLGAHPDIAALPTEGHFITDQFIKDYDIGLPRMWHKREDIFRLTEDSVGPDPDRVKKEWAMRLNARKKIFLEKSPPNTPRMLWLQKHFEDAHFIALVRNGYAVSEGIRRKADPKHKPESWPISDCAKQWARSYEMIEEDAPKLNKLMWIRYEDLAEHPQQSLHKLSEFIGLDAYEGWSDDADWTIHERSESVSNLNQVSIDKLSAQDIKDINAVAGEMMLKQGYSLL